MWDDKIKKKKRDDDCKIVVRKSGTENLIRILMMARDLKLVDRYSNELYSLVQNLTKEY